MIDPPPCGGNIGMPFVPYGAVARNEVLGTLVADVVFRGFEVDPIGRSFRANRMYRYQSMIDIALTAFGQQLLNSPFRLFVIALAELVMSNIAPLVDKIECGPIVVSEGTP